MPQTCTEHQSSKVYNANLTKLQGETDSFIKVAGHFRTQFSVIQEQAHKISMEMGDVNTTDKLDLQRHRECHPTTAEYTFFSSSHGTFSSIYEATKLNKF